MAKKDLEIANQNGDTHESGLQVWAETTAQNIKDCGNACDAWTKKRLAVKIFIAPVWEKQLAGFNALFTKRQNELVAALAVFTALGVNALQSDIREMKKMWV